MPWREVGSHLGAVAVGLAVVRLGFDGGMYAFCDVERVEVHCNRFDVGSCNGVSPLARRIC